MPEGRDDAKVGEELVKRDVITRQELDEARKREKLSGVPWYRQLIQTRKIGFGMLDDVLRHEFHPKAKRTEDQNLGRRLVEMKAITEKQLEAALAIQKRTGRLLGKILLDEGHVSRKTIGAALASQHEMDFAELADTPSDRRALDAIPESVARKNQMIPFHIEGDRLSVLVADPQVSEALKDVSVLLGFRIHPVLTAVDDIRAEITRRYRMPRGRRISAAEEVPEPAPAPAAERGRKRKAETKPEKTPTRSTKSKGKETVASSEKTVEKVNEKLRERLRFSEIAQQAAGVPVIKLVQTIIEGAANSGATDIHLDPQEPEMRVRYRIDGVLHDVMSIPPEIEPAVVSRLKIMADIDITETRHPQDGHISVDVGEMEFDIRVATMPTYLGERVVLRLLDQSSVLSGVKDLGLENEDQKSLIELIKQPYGMILVTGPTGSGKTTTLYAALNQKNVMEESIVTLEDPVEYQLSGINQVQIDAEIGRTFAETLRASLRQDIDVLLVGEIRDAETARIAIRAAMTGHLVFSTMHTNDAPEAITTLRNMGIPSYLIASALTAVMAQRLVRKICPECKTSFTPTKALLQSVNLPATVKRLYRGKGCDACYHTGNKGRTGIFEVLEVTGEIRKMISVDESTDKVAKAAKLKTMADRCRQKLREGIVAPEEFLRVIRT